MACVAITSMGQGETKGIEVGENKFKINISKAKVM
jgi:hypothetical protein